MCTTIIGTTARCQTTLVVLVASFLPLAAFTGCRDDLPPKPQPGHDITQPTSSTADHAEINSGSGRKRVLLVHSYHAGYPWVETITQGVESAINVDGPELQVFYMDTKRHTDESWKIEAGKRAKELVKSYRPDVVLAADDDAQQYFAMSYVNTSLPIVFTGVDADPSKYGYPSANVTGVIERPHLRESLALARRLRPLRRIAVLSCHDSTSIVALGFMKQEQLDVEVSEWLMVDDFDQWKQAVQRFNTSVDGLIIRSYQAVKTPGSEVNVDPREVATWTAENATIPTIAFHDFEIRDGLLVGVVKSGQEYGRKAMDYALQILGGTNPSSLPVVRSEVGIPMINATTARHLGITLNEAAIAGVNMVPAE